MTKIWVLALLILVSLSFDSFGKEFAATQVTKSASAISLPGSRQFALENSGAAKWLLIGIDTVLTGISIYMVADERKSADDYAGLFNSINNTTVANYQVLKNKKSEGDNKAMSAGVVSGITAFFLAYTAADILWFHMVFGKDVKTVLIPENREIKISWNREF
jgi:hypothetical protein